MDDSLDPTICSRFLKALADSLRLQVVEFLLDGPKTVTEIAEHLKVEMSNASHHLHVLSNAGLVTTRKDGKFCYYSLPADILVRGTRNVTSRLEFGCCRLELGQRPQQAGSRSH